MASELKISLNSEQNIMCGFLEIFMSLLFHYFSEFRGHSKMVGKNIPISSKSVYSHAPNH